MRIIVVIHARSQCCKIHVVACIDTRQMQFTFHRLQVTTGGGVVVIGEIFIGSLTVAHVYFLVVIAAVERKFIARLPQQTDARLFGLVIVDVLLFTT